MKSLKDNWFWILATVAMLYVLIAMRPDTSKMTPEQKAEMEFEIRSGQMQN